LGVGSIMTSFKLQEVCHQVDPPNICEEHTNWIDKRVKIKLIIILNYYKVASISTEIYIY
jgi:hypothetical protein